MSIKIYSWIALAIIPLLALSACAAPQPASLEEDQVAAMLENILLAINTDDHSAFSRDFSPEMLAAFPEAEFADLRQVLQQASGDYLALDGQPTLLNNGGYAVYRFPCRFEKENVIVTLTFKIGADQVEGLFFDSTNLRAASE